MVFYLELFLSEEYDDHLLAHAYQLALEEDEQKYQEPQIIKCTVCGVSLEQSEYDDHSLAHILQSNMNTNTAPYLSTTSPFKSQNLPKIDVNDFPSWKFEKNKGGEGSCGICHCEFDEGEEIK
eukprot:TRINITY_DN5444_c0_g1_i2.p1 TRINITY_DN5444_c0_g1~~TRINITY_DN5444_c0_g1_i2.p1  ORF type:complete len:123 (-),score=7.37 TRINITY_DN5444_c0_g1_i2:204-572(-)